MKRKITFLIAAAIMLFLNIFVLQEAVGQTPIKTSDLYWGTPVLSENFDELDEVTNTGNSNSNATVTYNNLTAYGIFNKISIGKKAAHEYSIIDDDDFDSKIYKLTSKGTTYFIASITGHSEDFGSTGAYSIKVGKTDYGFFGLYATDDGNNMSHANASVFIRVNNGALHISDGGTTSTKWISIGSYTTDTISISVVYNNTNNNTSYDGGEITLNSKKAHVYVNGRCVMDNQSPKEFTIPGSSLTVFRCYPNNSNNSVIRMDDVMIYNTLPALGGDVMYSATNGTISGVVANTSTEVNSGANIAQNTQITLTATPDDGYVFSSWSVTGTGASLSSTTTNPTTLTMGTAGATVTATFVENSASPAITVSTNSLSDFSYVVNNGPSESQMFTVSGLSLESNIIVSIANNSAFEMSEQDGNNWSAITSKELEKDGNGTVSATNLFVRMKSGLDSGDKEGSITITSTNADDKTIELTGNVIPTKTITWHHGAGGNTQTETVTYNGATLNTLPIPNEVNGWTALGWAANYTSGYPELVTAPLEVTNEMTDFYAVYRHGNNVVYQLTTSTSDLVANTRYMIGIAGYALMKTNFSSTQNVTLDGDNQFVYSAGAQWKLGGSNNSWTFTDTNGKYLSSQSTTGANASLKLETTATDYSYWSISYDNASPKHSVIQNNGNYTNNSKTLNISCNNGTFNCYNNTIVYLFKEVTEYSKAPTADKCHVYYNANGGTGTQTDVNEYDPGDEVTVLGPGTMEKEGYGFVMWSNMEDGEDPNAELYEEGDNFNIATNITLYAQWSILSYDYELTITGDDTDAIAELVVDDISLKPGDKIQYGKEVTVEVAVSDGYAYKIKVNDELIISNTFNMPASDVDVKVITEIDPYVNAKLTSDNMLSMTTETTNQYGYGYLKTKTITVNDTTYIWQTNGFQHTNNNNVDLGMIQLRVRTNNNGVSYIKLPDLSGKIETIVFAVSGNGNNDNNPTASTTSTKLYFQEAPTKNGEIIAEGGGTETNTITIYLIDKCYTTGYIVADGGIRIWNIKVKYRPYQDNAGNTITSIDDDVTVSIPSGSVSATDLTIPASSGLIIKSGATLNVSGTLTNSGNANNLIIEDGGQLITNSSIPLTYKKQITSAAKDGGWYTISTPVHTASNSFLEHESVENLILSSESNYDFFRYDEASHTWINYKKGEFDLNIGQGYLYRNNGAELHFAGYNNQATYYEKALSYASSEDKLLGFNLIGNPYPQNITMSDVTVNNGGTLTGGYVLSESGAWSADVAATITPTQGFLVQIDKTGVTARITKPAGGAKSRSDRDYLKFIVANSQYEDAAFALFEEGYGLNKIDHRNSDVPMLYIPKDRDIFAIATMDNSTQSFNLNFKAKTTGKYTLSYEATGEYSYLHVIDRLTGEDVDMLLEGEYSFIASPSDNENRFIVNMRYSNNVENSENSIFAYQNGNDIVVNGEGEMQIFDVMGRMVGSQRINGVQTINIPLRGVYIFRLNEKTQKIVVE